MADAFDADRCVWTSSRDLRVPCCLIHPTDSAVVLHVQNSAVALVAKTALMSLVRAMAFREPGEVNTRGTPRQVGARTEASACRTRWQGRSRRPLQQADQPSTRQFKQ